MQVQVSNEYLQHTRRSNGISGYTARITQDSQKLAIILFKQDGRCFKIGSQPYIAKRTLPNGRARKPKSNLEDFAVIPGALLRIENWSKFY
jgi:hypothetical protein